MNGNDAAFECLEIQQQQQMKNEINRKYLYCSLFL